MYISYILALSWTSLWARTFTPGMVRVVATTGRMAVTVISCQVNTELKLVASVEIV